jgi:RimJ/RimL family protein N-acetyltransferase
MVPIPDAIETERLVIRPFEPKDRDAYVAFMTDPEATRYLLFTDEQRTEAVALDLLDAVLASYATDEPIFAYTIARKDDDAFVGSCGMSDLGEAGRLECYYSLLPDQWGRGFATEATEGLLAYAFAQPEVEEVWAFMSPENPRAAGVAERAGMAREGVREHPVFGNAGLAYVARRDA